MPVARPITVDTLCRTFCREQRVGKSDSFPQLDNAYHFMKVLRMLASGEGEFSERNASTISGI
jgi:hypothetical protein